MRLASLNPVMEEDEVNAKIDALFPVKGKTAEGGGFFSRADLEFQRLARDALEGVYPF